MIFYQIQCKVVALSRTEWSVYKNLQVEDYSQEAFIPSSIYEIFTRRTHSRYIQFDMVLQRVLSRRSRWNVLSVRLFSITARNVLPDSSANQQACWSADSHVNLSPYMVCQQWRDVGHVTARLVDALERVSRVTSADTQGRCSSCRTQIPRHPRSQESVVDEEESGRCVVLTTDATVAAVDSLVWSVFCTQVTSQ